ncbi:MAG: hypothetical protein HPY61_10275 [Methanotrichaceae archaeon]|nr:hypothetical protein [Methanotrichaceae archaeon]
MSKTTRTQVQSQLFVEEDPLFHNDRRYCVKHCSAVDELVADIVREKCILCRGWEVDGYLFLNDSFDESGIFDIAVLRIKDRIGNQYVCDQIDSIAIDLYDANQLREYINAAMKPDVLAHGEQTVTIETPRAHQGCVWCA